MGESKFFAVYLHPQAIEALGASIKPYLIDGPSGLHIPCIEVDTGGAMCEMTLQGKSINDKPIELELMIPIGMILMIISVHSDDQGFGFA